MNIVVTTAENVRALMQQRKISLRRLAAAIGVSASTLSDAMRSRHGLSIAQLAAIAAYFQVSLDALCDPAFQAKIGTSPAAAYASSRAAYLRLDPHGRRVVDAVLALELERCEGEKSPLSAVAPGHGQDFLG